MSGAAGESGMEHGSNYSRKFERLLGMFPHPERKGHPDPEKRKWKGVELSRATEGRLSSGYITGLRSGRIKRPGPEHLDLIAHVMGFPFELWLTDSSQWNAILKRARDARAGTRVSESGAGSLAERVEQLFASIPNRMTGNLYTNREVADLSGGRLSEDDLEKMRGAELFNPSRAQLLALCDIFDVDFSYWGGGDRKPMLDEQTIRALRSDKSYLLLQKSLNLSPDKMDMVLLLMDQLDRLEAGSRSGRTEGEAES